MLAFSDPARVTRSALHWQPDRSSNTLGPSQSCIGPLYTWGSAGNLWWLVGESSARKWQVPPRRGQDVAEHLGRGCVGWHLSMVAHGFSQSSTGRLRARFKGALAETVGHHSQSSTGRLRARFKGALAETVGHHRPVNCLESQDFIRWKLPCRIVREQSILWPCSALTCEMPIALSRVPYVP